MSYGQSIDLQQTSRSASLSANSAPQGLSEKTNVFPVEYYVFDTRAGEHMFPQPAGAVESTAAESKPAKDFRAITARAEARITRVFDEFKVHFRVNQLWEKQKLSLLSAAEFMELLALARRVPVFEKTAYDTGLASLLQDKDTMIPWDAPGGLLDFLVGADKKNAKELATDNHAVRHVTLFNAAWPESCVHFSYDRSDSAAHVHLLYRDTTEMSAEHEVAEREFLGILVKRISRFLWSTLL